MKIIKKLFICIAVLFSTFSVSAQTEQLEEVKKMFNDAATMITAKQYGEAIVTLEKTIELGFDADAIDAIEIVQQAQKLLPRCYFEHGFSLVRENKLNEALPVLAKADELGQLYSDNANSRKSKNMISRIYTIQGGSAFNSKDYATAVESFKKGYAVNPQDTGLALNLAKAYCELGDWKNGVKTYTDVIALGKRHSRFAESAEQAQDELIGYLINRAIIEITSKKYTDAYASLGQVIDIDIANDMAQMLRIQAATNAKNWNKVIEWGEMAADMQLTDVLKSAAYYYLAGAYDMKDNNAKAIEVYGKVIAGKYAAAAKKRIGELKLLKQ